MPATRRHGPARGTCALLWARRGTCRHGTPPTVTGGGTFLWIPPVINSYRATAVARCRRAAEPACHHRAADCDGAASPNAVPSTAVVERLKTFRMLENGDNPAAARTAPSGFEANTGGDTRVHYDAGSGRFFTSYEVLPAGATRSTSRSATPPARAGTGPSTSRAATPPTSRGISSPSVEQTPPTT